MPVKKIVVDARVIIDPPAHNSLYVYQRKGETWGDAYARELQGWVNDLNDFLRDHRSQDDNRLSVERVMGCSQCGQEWETETDEDGTVICSGCGGEVDTGKKTTTEAK